MNFENHSNTNMERRWGQSMKPGSTIPGTKPVKRAALGEVSNTVKPKPRGGNGGASHSIKSKHSVAVSASASSVDIVKPNLLAHTDPEQTREVREFAGLDLVPNKGFYLPTQVLTADRDAEDLDENYPEVEQMGYSDEFYSTRPPAVDTEFIDSVIPGDIEPEFPEYQILGSDDTMTAAEEIEISLNDLSLVEDEIDTEKF